LAFPDARALVFFSVPGRAVLDEFGPERIQAALRRFGGVDRATIGAEEMALTAAWLSKTKEMAVAYDVFRLKRCHRHSDKARGTGEIVFRQVDEAALPAAFGAPGLAGETERVH
jgi:hypothetical protein